MLKQEPDLYFEISEVAVTIFDCIVISCVFVTVIEAMFGKHVHVPRPAYILQWCYSVVVVICCHIGGTLELVLKQ